jgi:hypothetical protein
MGMMMMMLMVTLLTMTQTNFRTGRRGQTVVAECCAGSVYPLVLGCELT